MFIAQEKKKSNIIEYVLYLWQVENIIRACQFDVNIIEQNVINQMGLDANEKSLVIDWYTDLVKQMKSQALQQDGHLAFTKEIIVELAMLHQTLLKTFQDKLYNPAYNNARGDIYDLQKKQLTPVSEIEACLNGLFGLWMLKIGKKEVSAATQQSFDRISKLLARLGKNYHEMMAIVS